MWFLFLLRNKEAFQIKEIAYYLHPCVKNKALVSSILAAGDTVMNETEFSALRELTLYWADRAETSE